MPTPETSKDFQASLQVGTILDTVVLSHMMTGSVPALSFATTKPVPQVSFGTSGLPVSGTNQIAANGSVVTLGAANLSINFASPTPAKNRLSYDETLATLPLVERWMYAAKYNVSDIVFGCLAAVIGVWSVISAALHLIPEIIDKSSAAGVAKSPSPISIGRGYDPMDWFIMGCIGAILIWTLWNANKSGSGESVKLARENMRFFVGGFMGYFGGKAR
jgi:hypothetical protein